jgi:hypothetical protein
MQQTATEWMANELLYLDNEYDMKLIDKNEYQARRKQIIEQAKEMELEKLKEAYSMGRLNKSIKEFNETFKPE